MKKKILILGGNNFFLGIIKAAKKLNYKVIAIDKNSNSIAKYYADEFYNLDFSKSEKVLNFAKKNRILGITTHQSDAGVKTVGYVNSKLKLVGPTNTLAQICSNKVNTRKFLNKKINQPKFKIIDDLNKVKLYTNYIGFPCIIKPSMSSGSRGIEIFKSLKDLKKISLLKKYYKNTEFILEKFINGIEFGAQVLVLNGKTKKVFTHNDIFLNKKTPVPIGHSFPSKLSKKSIIKLKIYIDKIVKILKIKNSILNLDFILGEDKKIYLLEIGLRSGATCIPDLIMEHSGINWEEIIIKMSMGEKIREDELLNKKNIPVAGEVLLSKKSFFLKKMILPSEVNKNLIKIQLDKKTSFKVKKFKNGTDRFGYILVKEKSVKKAEKLCKKIKKNIKFVS